MSTIIHHGAFVDPAAKLGEGVEIMPGAVVTRWAQLGDRVVVHPGAVVGGDPQYGGFDRSLPSYVRVGADSILRESVTLNRSLSEGQATMVGERSFFMAGSHAGHDCILADDVILANHVMLAGHVEVGQFTFIGGGAGIHQHCRIGAVAMVSGLSRISKDVSPYCMVAERDEMAGLNLVGLKRQGWSREVIREIKEVYRAVLQTTGSPRPVAAAWAGQVQSDQARVFLDFFAGGKRGFARPVPRQVPSAST